MNDEIRLAVLTVAASFAATFGYLRWQHGPLWPVTSLPTRQAAAPIVRAQPEPGPVSSPSVNTLPAEPVATPAAASIPETNLVPAANLDGPTLPLLVAFATVAASPSNREEPAESGASDETTRDQIDIKSTSDQLMAVTVIDVNPTTKKSSSTQVLLPPNGQSQINADSGLPLQSGDEVTLRSPGFRDMSQRAP